MTWSFRTLLGYLAAVGGVTLAQTAAAQGGDELAPPPTPATEIVVVEQPSSQDPPEAQPQPQAQPAGSSQPPATSPFAPEGYGQPQPAQPQPQPAPVYAPQQQQQPYAQQYRRPRRLRLAYREGMEVPPNAEVVERRKSGLWITGMAVFLGTYLTSVTVASIDDELRPFYAPFIGPIIWQIRDGFSDTAALTIVLSLAQTAGIVLFALGMRKRTYVEYWATTPRGRHVAVLPQVDRHQLGLSLTVF